MSVDTTRDCVCRIEMTFRLLGTSYRLVTFEAEMLFAVYMYVSQTTPNSTSKVYKQISIRQYPVPISAYGSQRVEAWERATYNYSTN